MPNIKNHSTIKAISLIELLIYCTLIIIFSLSNYNNFTYFKQQQKITKLKKLQHALHLAHYEAINKRTKVQLCPSYDLLHCSQNWSNDVIIFIEENNNHINILHHLQLKFAESSLRFFDNQNTQIITFLPNGLTNNNGNFCINDPEQHCLYINKAGKTYITKNTILK